MKKKLFSLISALIVLSACNGINNSSKNSSTSSSSNYESTSSSIHTSSTTSSSTSSSISSSTSTSISSSISSSSSKENDELVEISIAEFLSRKDSDTFYILSGKVTKITNTQYGNFILEDSTGSIFVWGLYTDKDSTDKYGFSSLGIKEGDSITIAGVYYYYDKDQKDEVKDAYFISKESNGTTSNYLYNDFTSEEKELFMISFGEILPFMPNDEYYIDPYSYIYEDNIYEEGLNFYTFGNTPAEFQDYLDLLSKYELTGIEKDEYGDDWYYFDSDNFYIDVSHYLTTDGEYVLDLYIYTLEDLSESEEPDDPIETDGNVLTNKGKGLPSSQNGVYNVDFTKAKYVKNVTDQGYYLDGCPTTGNAAVLVVPVEFSDVTAKSKGYSFDKINTAFNGSKEECDYMSVHDYYYESSFGKLDLDITVLNEWFMPKENSEYYASATMEYGNSEVACGDQLIIDELLAYLEGKMDLSKFDSDKNNVIDSIVLINTLDIDSNSDFQWAYRYWNILTDDEGYYYEYDGVSANDYLWASYDFMFEAYDEEGNFYYDENAMNTYTYIHEFGHILGADDYYDTSSKNHPLEGFDVMDSMTGDHNAFTKFNYGWLTSSRLVVADGPITLELEDFSKNGDTIIIANNFDEDLGAYQEYYIVVYYTNNGLNEGDYGYFSRDGIVVYHVNASLYKEEYYGTTYYDIYNNNTDVSSQYGSKDNLIEFVKSPNDTFTYVEGDSLSTSIVDDQGNSIAYSFVVDSLTETTATLTFTKN